MILKRRMIPKMSRLMWATVLLLGAIVLPVAAQMPGNDEAPATSERLEERVKRLETLLESLQAAINSSTEAPGDIHFTPMSGKEIQEQRLRQELRLREKNRESK